MAPPRPRRSSSPSPEAADAVLRIEGVAGPGGAAKPPLLLSISDLADMPHTKAGVRGRDGKERVYDGVLLAIAPDGYPVLFSLPEADPAFSEARIIVADPGAPALTPPGSSALLNHDFG